MDNRLTILVTQEQIDNGHKGECGACPIAIAIADLFWVTDKKDREVFVDIYEMDDNTEQAVAWVESDDHDGGYTRFDIHWLPPEVKDFINLFDAGEEVKPFGFNTIREPLVAVARHNIDKVVRQKYADLYQGQ